MLTAQVYFVYFEKNYTILELFLSGPENGRKNKPVKVHLKKELKIQMNYLSLGWIIHRFHIKSENDFSSCNPHLNKKNSLSMALNVSKLSLQRESIA